MRNEVWETALCSCVPAFSCVWEIWLEKKEWGGSKQRSRCCSSAWKDPLPEQMDIPRGMAACGEPTLGYGETVRKGRWVAERDRLLTSPSIPCAIWSRGPAIEGRKLSLHKVGGKAFIYVFLFLAAQIYLYWQ